MKLKDLFSEDYVMRELLDQMCLDGSITTSLQENLMKYKKDDLMHIADMLEMDIPKKLNKDDFTKAMVACYQDEDLLTSVYINLSDLELYLMENLINGGKPLVGIFRYLAVKFLTRYGFVHMYKQDDSYRIIISDEIKKVFGELDQENLAFIRASQQFIQKYTSAAINLYGIISFELLLEHYKQHLIESHQEVLDDDILKALFIGQLVTEPHYFFDGDYFMSLFYEEIGVKIAYEIVNNGKPYYRPKLETFLLYAEMGHIDKNHAYLAMEEFVMHYITTIPNAVENFMTSLEYHCEYGHVKDVIEELNEMEFEFEDEAQLSHFMQLYQDYTNNKRMWFNHGLTPYELKAPMKKSVKIGRNDRCPCGSGKKYKKCCGNHLTLVQ